MDHSLDPLSRGPLPSGLPTVGGVLRMEYAIRAPGPRNPNPFRPQDLWGRTATGIRDAVGHHDDVTRQNTAHRNDQAREEEELIIAPASSESRPQGAGFFAFFYLFFTLHVLRSTIHAPCSTLYAPRSTSLSLFALFCVGFFIKFYSFSILFRLSSKVSSSKIQNIGPCTG